MILLQPTNKRLPAEKAKVERDYVNLQSSSNNLFLLDDSATLMYTDFHVVFF